MSMVKALDTNKKLLMEAKVRKMKLKKNALDTVDLAKESKNDPKFKTELCKSWIETGFCIYGNKCRFAHGRDEIFDKPINNTKYKQKNCISFFKNGYCNYGTRCHFKHDERTFDDIIVPYFQLKLITTDFSQCLQQPEKNNSSRKNSILSIHSSNTLNKRLEIFKNIYDEEDNELKSSSNSILNCFVNISTNNRDENTACYSTDSTANSTPNLSRNLINYDRKEISNSSFQNSKKIVGRNLFVNFPKVIGLEESKISVDFEKFCFNGKKPTLVKSNEVPILVNSRVLSHYY